MEHQATEREQDRIAQQIESLRAIGEYHQVKVYHRYPCTLANGKSGDCYVVITTTDDLIQAAQDVREYQALYRGGAFILCVDEPNTLESILYNSVQPQASFAMYPRQQTVSHYETDWMQ